MSSYLKFDEDFALWNKFIIAIIGVKTIRWMFSDTVEMVYYQIIKTKLQYCGHLCWPLLYFHCSQPHDMASPCVTINTVFTKKFNCFNCNSIDHSTRLHLWSNWFSVLIQQTAFCRLWRHFAVFQQLIRTWSISQCIVQ